MSATEIPLAADGTTLKSSLNRALRRQKIRALMLIAPLLIFIMLSFVWPIGEMLFRSVQNQLVSDTIPHTISALDDWDATTGEGPEEEVFAALYVDLMYATEAKQHSRLGTRLNYELTGISSLFRRTGRAVDKFDTDAYTDQFVAAAPEFEDGAAWASWMANADIRAALPETARSYDNFARIITELEEGDPAAETPWDFVFTGLYRDLSAGQTAAGLPEVDVSGWEEVSIKGQFTEVNDKWLDHEVWATIKTNSGRFTNGYFLNSIDRLKGPDGIEQRPEDERIYIRLFIRTMIMSVTITLSCILLGYPIAWILANLPLRTANVLMILVLLPFWTSLLVRTAAWKVLLQQQGVINDTLVWLGLVSDGGRLVLMNNATGTVIAMTHILLPFMILPLYSVMKTIPETYTRAAKSLGATDWTAFWRVYFPQSIPGIGAGSILVFILAIGYYITPEIVGGTKGVFISNRIAYHISSSLNWGLAAALGTILLVLVMGFYWMYDKIVGIDNVKLG